ncbi:MAG: O-antigen ligase family protein [Bacteroidales bacterium]|nr:O-antigen ligase family protein [Bacteroidales bacterium]
MSKQEFAYCVLICASLLLGIFSIKLLIILIPFFIFYNKKTEKKIILSKSKIIVIISFLIYSLFGIIFSDYIPNSLSFNIDLAVLLAFYLITDGKFFISQYQKNIVKYIFNGFISIICIITCFIYISHQTTFTEFGYNELTNFKLIYSPLFMHCNNFATLMLCFLPLILISIIFENHKKIKIWYITNFVLSIFCIITTYSRGVYLALVVFLMLIILTTAIFNKSQAKNILIYIILALGFSFAIVITNSTMRNSVATTFAFNKTESQKRSFDSRLNKLNLYSEDFSWFGCGSGNFAIKNLNNLTNYDTMVSVSSTNSFLQLYVERGLFGLIFFVAMACFYFINIRKKIFKGNIITIVSSSGLVALAIREFTFGTFTIISAIVLLSFIMICFTLNNDENEK